MTGTQEVTAVILLRAAVPPAVVGEAVGLSPADLDRINARDKAGRYVGRDRASPVFCDNPEGVVRAVVSLARATGDLHAAGLRFGLRPGPLADYLLACLDEADLDRSAPYLPRREQVKMAFREAGFGYLDAGAADVEGGDDAPAG